MKLRFVLLLFVLAPSLHAQPVPRCSEGFRLLNVSSGQEVTLPVVPVTGATLYRVQIASRWSVIHPNRFLIKGAIVDRSVSPGQPIRETFYNTKPGFASEVYVVVIAEVPQNDGSRTYCSQDFIVVVQPEARLARDATRVVVPVAGSVRGAFNSVFKTRLLLENRWGFGTLTGRIIFHQRGTAGSSSDPSIAYSLEPRTFITYDDIAATMQLDNVIGSLDIVPDAFESAYALPQVRADLISIGANGGEFAASIPDVTSTSGYPGALLGTPEFLVEPPRNKRISVGVRSLADAVEITAYLLTPDRAERARATRQYAADFYEQTPLSSWFNDLQQPGDTILFLVRPSSSSTWIAGAIVFLAETDNVTNDVTIVSPTELQTLSQPVIVCGSGHGCSVL